MSLKQWQFIGRQLRKIELQKSFYGDEVSVHHSNFKSAFLSGQLALRSLKQFLFKQGVTKCYLLQGNIQKETETDKSFCYLCLKSGDSSKELDNKSKYNYLVITSNTLFGTYSIHISYNICYHSLSLFAIYDSNLAQS